MAQIGIAIGLPFGGRLIHPKFAVALKTVDFPVNTTQTIICVENRPITEARNMIAKSALDNNCRYLFFLDDDVIIPRHTIQALGHVLDNYVDENVMVSTGVYCTKNYSPSPVIYRDGFSGGYLDWRVNDIFDVDGAGAGCMMINTKVFESLEYPYFREEQGYIDDPVTGEKIYSALSEDLYFCKSVREKGFKIKCHGSVICPHYDTASNKFYTLPEDSLPFKRELSRQQEEIKRKEENNG